MFTVCPAFAMSHEKKGGWIIEILHTLLNKVSTPSLPSCSGSYNTFHNDLFQVVPADIKPELAKSASSTLLQMLVNLRYWYRQCAPSENEASGGATSTSLAVINPASDPKLALGPKTNSLNLKYILKHIVEWIIISSVSSQKLKINLYASLLNFMHIVKEMNKRTPDTDETPSEK